ncbi:MAG: DUF5985 family protein [Chlamydiota bacterium]
MINSFLSGSILISSWCIACFFYRFSKKRKDVLFFQFALAFFLLGMERIVLVFVSLGSEFHAYTYMIRLIAFILIISGIISKNISLRAENKNKN